MTIKAMGPAEVFFMVMLKDNVPEHVFHDFMERCIFSRATQDQVAADDDVRITGDAGQENVALTNMPKVKNMTANNHHSVQ